MSIEGASARNGSTARVVSAFEEPAPESTFNALTLSELSNGVLSSVSSTVLTQVQLHWSEYTRGEWTTRESGGIASSFVAPVPFGFTPLTVPVHVSKDREGDEDRAVYIHLGGPVGRAFKLAGRNSTPTDVPAGPAPRHPYNAREVRATRLGGTGALTVTLNRRVTATNGGPAVAAPEVFPVMGATEPFTLLVCDNDIGFGTPEIASLVKPFFYQDSTHTYYVEPDLEEHTIEEWKDYLVKTPVPDIGGTSATWPDPIRYVPEKPKVKAPYLTDPGDPVFSRPLDQGSLYRVKAPRDWLVNDSTGVLFDGEVIGSSGRAGLSVLTKSAAAGAVREGARQVEVPPGSEVPPGGGIFIDPGRAIDRIKEVLVAPDQGMTLIGGGGLTQVVEQNVGRLNRLTDITDAAGVRLIR